MQTADGYTLMETMMVLVIVMILACCALPDLHRWFSRANDEVLTTQLEQAIAFAQAESGARYSAVGLRLDNIKGLIVFLKESDQAIRYLPFHQQGGVLHWRSYPYYRDYVLFVPEGTLESDNATFWYCYQRQTAPAFAVTLSKSGITHRILPDKQGDVRDASGKKLMC